MSVAILNPETHAHLCLSLLRCIQAAAQTEACEPATMSDCLLLLEELLPSPTVLAQCYVEVTTAE